MSNGPEPKSLRTVDNDNSKLNVPELQFSEQNGTTVKTFDGLTFSGATTQTETNAQAENSTEAAKMMYPGQVSVNPRTGAPSVQFSVPAFAGLDLSFSYSAIAAQYQSPFRLPSGINLIGIPFIHKALNNVSALNFNGQDYYIDSRYCSVLTDGTLYHSGLKYQTSKDIWFKNHIELRSCPEIVIHDNGGQVQTKQIAYELKAYSNDGELKHFFFDKDGFCFAIANKYFCNDLPHNYKYLTQLHYESTTTVDVNLAKLVSITDGNSKQLTITYTNSNKDILFTLPTGASSTAYEFYIHKRSSEIILGHSLNDEFDYHLRIDTGQKRLSNVYEDFYNRCSKSSVVNKIYHLEYDDHDHPSFATQLQVIDGKTKSKKLVTRYDYMGDREHNFEYGADQAYNTPNINTLKSTYSTLENNGKQETIHYFNKLSQEIKTEFRSLKSTTRSTFGDLIGCIINQYPQVVSYDPDSQTNRLVSNYQSPERTFTIMYDRLGSDEPKPVAVSKKHFTIDDYNNALSEKEFPLIRFESFASNKQGEIQLPEYDSAISAVKETIKQYDYRFITLILQTERDFSADRSRTLENILSDNGTNVLQQTEYAANLSGDKVSHLPTSIYEYAEDHHIYPDSNFINKSLVIRKQQFLPDCANEHITTTYTYNVDLQSQADQFYRLVVSTKQCVESDLDVPKSLSMVESINNQSVKEINPNQLVTTTNYDVSGQKTEVKHPEGVKEVNSIDYENRTYTSTMFDINGDKSYLNSFKEFDFLNQILCSRERCKDNGNISTYQTSASIYDYTLGGKLVTSIDNNGNKEEHTYDSYRGLPSKISYLQNVGENEFQFYGESSYEYQIEWFNNELKNCYLLLTEKTNGDKGEINQYKGLDKNTLYEQARWISGQLKSKVINELTLSGVLVSSKTFLPESGGKNDTERLRDIKSYQYNLFGEKTRINQTIFSDEGISLYDYCMEYQYDNWFTDKEVKRTFVTKQGDYSSYRTIFDVLGQERGLQYQVDNQVLNSDVLRDASGAITKTCDFEKNTINNRYDDVSGLLRQRRCNAHDLPEQTIDISYDNFAMVCNQQSTNHFSDAKALNEIGLPKQLLFTAPGDLLANLALTKQKIAYDDKNRVKQAINAQGLTFNFSYLPGGSLKNVNFSNEAATVYGQIEYDYYPYEVNNPMWTNKQKSVSTHFNSPSISYQQRKELTYDSMGRTATEISIDSTGRYITSYEYNELDEVIGKHSSINIDDKIATETAEIYSYDAMSRLVRSETNHTESCTGNHKTTRIFSYDDCSNIVKEESVSGTYKQTSDYIYNNANQLTQKEVVDETDNQTISTTTTNYSYNNNGNLLRETLSGQSGNSLYKKYTYNTLNQMVKVESEMGIVEYDYYPSGHRAAKKMNNEMVVYLYDIDGNLSNTLLFDLNCKEKLRKIDSYFGECRFIVDVSSNDAELQLGHMRLNKSNCTTIINQNSLPYLLELLVSDYGVVKDTTNTNLKEVSQNKFDYMQYPYVFGQSYFDAETGLYYMNARYYSPTLARFLAQDNADYETVPNRYLYALANPVMNFDTTGHSAEGWLTLGISLALFATGFALSPATVGGVEAFGLEAKTIKKVSRYKGMLKEIKDPRSAFLIPSEQVASEAELIAVSERKDALNYTKQIVGNILVDAGADGMENSLKQISSDDYSWADWGKTVGAGALSGLFFGGVYAKRLNLRSGKAPLKGLKPKYYNVALYTISNVGANTIDTILTNAFNGERFYNGLGSSVASGLVTGATTSSITSFGNISYQRSKPW